MVFFEDLLFAPSAFPHRRQAVPAHFVYRPHTSFVARPRRVVARTPVHYFDPFLSQEVVFHSRPRYSVFDSMDLLDMVEPSPLDQLLLDSGMYMRNKAKTNINKRPEAEKANNAENQEAPANSPANVDANIRVNQVTQPQAENSSPKKPRTELFVATFDNESGWKYYKKSAGEEKLVQVTGPDSDEPVPQIVQSEQAPTPSPQSEQSSQPIPHIEQGSSPDSESAADEPQLPMSQPTAASVVVDSVVDEQHHSSSEVADGPTWSHELELLQAVGFDDKEALIPLLQEVMGEPSRDRTAAQQGLKKVLARLLM